MNGILVAETDRVWFFPTENQAEIIVIAYCL